MDKKTRPERWQEIERLCQSALEMESGKRESYVKKACAGDESLRHEVEALLANLSEAQGFMKDPAMEAAAKALAKDVENVPAKDLIGQSIAHYRIEEKIGEGGGVHQQQVRLVRRRHGEVAARAQRLFETHGIDGVLGAAECDEVVLHRIQSRGRCQRPPRQPAAEEPSAPR